mgnify:CR=1 FL=1
MTRNFAQRLAPLGLSVRELTGDMQLSKKEMAETQASGGVAVGVGVFRCWGLAGGRLQVAQSCALSCAAQAPPPPV